MSETFWSGAKAILRGESPDSSFFEDLSRLADKDAPCLFPGANLIREAHFGRKIQLCTIQNGKSGRCSEDCVFCAQSIHHSTEITEYGLQDIPDLKSKGEWAAQTPINRYSIVTSGRGLKDKDIAQVSQAMAELKNENITTCVSLGILDNNNLKRLYSAGIDRYHHNLETPRSFFPKVCTTHDFEDRVQTLQRAKALGFSLCSGGVFGLGESDQQILEMALELKNISVEAIPLNFLTPIPGTPAENFQFLTPLRCLKIISLFRYILPDKEIIVCGGRKQNLQELQSMIFMAGANGIMTGDYLTTQGSSLEEDLELISKLGFCCHSKQ